MKIRLALYAACPMYYQAPLYRRIAADPHIDFTAIFASTGGATRPFDGGYGRPVEWGVDSLDGYRSVFLHRSDTNKVEGGIFTLDPDIISVLAEGHYDVLWLHGYHTLTHLLAAVSHKLRGRPLLYREEQTLLHPRACWKTAIKRLGLGLLFHGSYGLFIGSENRRWFEHWGIAPQRLHHVPYAVENDLLQGAATELAPQRERLRADLGIGSASGPVILTLGRLIPKKQPLHLLEAFRLVRAQRQCTLLVVGSGPLEPELRKKVASERIPDVVFAGFLDQTQIARAYAAADVFALVSSHDETWGLVVNEAMNFGLPVVVSDHVGCAPDLVRPGTNGFIVGHQDVHGLSEALDELVVSAHLRRRFGDASRRIISTRTYEVAAIGLIAAVRAAVGERRWQLALGSERTTPAKPRE